MVMRETNGIDEQRAAMQADAKGERSSIYQELVRLSIVSVDGEKITQPYEALDGWNSKSRSLVMEAYGALNNLEPEEVGSFLGSAEDATPGNSVARTESTESSDEQHPSAAIGR